MKLKFYLLNILLIAALINNPAQACDYSIVVKPIDKDFSKDMAKLGVTLGLIHGIASGYKAAKEKHQEKVDNLAPWMPIAHFICYMNDSSYGYLCGSACGYTMGRLISEWLNQ